MREPSKKSSKEIDMSKIPEFIQPIVKYFKEFKIQDAKSKASLYYKIGVKDFNDVLQRMQNLKKSNYDLALFHYAQCNLFDTRFRFWVYKKFWHDAPEADYFIGRSYIEEKKYKKALPYLEAYLKSGDKKFEQEALFSLKIAKDDVEDINEVPDLIIRRNKHKQIKFAFKQSNEGAALDAIALEFSNQITTAVNSTEKPIGNKTLDVGSDAGKTAMILKESKVSAQMVLVDSSEEALDDLEDLKIGNINLYDKIHTKDIPTFIKNNNEKFNLIIAPNIFDYQRDPELLITQLSSLLQTDGLLGIVVKTHSDASLSKFVRIDESFHFSHDALKALFEKLGFAIKAEFRFSKETDIMASIFIACKK